MAAAHTHTYTGHVFTVGTPCVTQVQLGHRRGACVLQLGTPPLDKSEVLGLDRHQQFGLQDLLAATIEKIFFNLALCSVMDPEPVGSEFLAGSEKIKLL
jgi:hypothetical protein